MYTVKKPTVGDMRQVLGRDDIEQGDTLFLIAEMCILKDGVPVGREGLNAIPWDECAPLLEELNTTKKI